MNDAVLAGLTWLHLIAIVVWVGFFFNSVIFFTPLTKKHVPQAAMADYLTDYLRRARVISLSAIGIFAAVGYVMMISDHEYEGFGVFFANTWMTLIVTKHVIVLAMVVLALYMLYSILPRLVNALTRLANTEKPDKAASALVAGLARQQQLVVNSLAVLGLVVLLIISIVGAIH